MYGRWKMGVVALAAVVASLLGVAPGRVAPGHAAAGGPNSHEARLPHDDDLTEAWLARRTQETAGAPLAASALSVSAALPTTRFAGFTTMSPERLLDTRLTGGAIGPGAVRGLQVTGRNGVPADATAVVMNVTVTEPTEGGFLTVWPDGTARPNTSSLNMTAGQTVANLVAVRVGADGRVAIYNLRGATHVVADVVAWTRDDGHFVGVSPARILDTRDTRPIGPGGAIDVAVLGRGPVPASGVSTVVMNVTVTDPTDAGFLTVWPTGSPRPIASTHNFVAGQSVPNLVFAPVGAGGQVSIYNLRGATHVIADVVGYIPAGAAYIPVNPQRLMDTRGMQGDYGRLVGSTVVRVPGPLGPRSTFTLDLDSVLDDALPGLDLTTMAAAVLNVTTVDATEATYLTVWPSGVAQPLASNINPIPGSVIPNAVVVRPGREDRVNIYNGNGWVHVVVDLVGLVPLQNVEDALDEAAGAKFHVLYVRGSDSHADIPAALATIRAEVAALNGWFALPAQAGRPMNFDRRDGELEVNVVTYPQFTTGQLVNWDSADCQGFPVLRQLTDDGWGNGQNRRWLVYFDGDRREPFTSPCTGAPAGTGTCGIAVLQFTTVFMHSACGTVSGSTPAEAVGAAPNTARVALHEMLHGLGAVPRCAPHRYSERSAHVTDPSDLMYPSEGPGVKVLDPDRDDYFGHGRPDCVDVARSPYLAPA